MTAIFWVLWAVICAAPDKVEYLLYVPTREGMRVHLKELRKLLTERAGT